MKQKFVIVILFLLLGLVSGCFSRGSDFSAPCEERQALFCEDFEGIDPTLGGNQLVTSTSVDQWWITSDDDQDYLFQGFPLFGRTRSNMILLSGSSYEDRSASFLYTREIDLSSATRASLGFNLIYRTEKHWDGLVVFAITDGIAGVRNPQNWVMLTPLEGYPDSVLLNGSLIPGYSGISAGWTHHEFDLSSFLGQKMILGFYFSSDDYLGDWGVGLDDIVVDADDGQVANQMAVLTENTISELKVSRNPLISPELPRANALADTPCVSLQDDQLDESQRAIIKAISESGNRVLVLHPQNGSFCWVDQDEIWIDGNTDKTPYMQETSRNTYFSVSSFSRTPTASDPSCDSGLSDDLPVYLQSALVQNGKITTLLFDPLLPGQEGMIPSDPRIGNPDVLAGLEPGSNPGGQIQGYIHESVIPCQMDWNHPGNVICQGLNLESMGNLDLELCWLGWDETQACPIGYYFNNTSGACIPIDEGIGCQFDCEPGYQFSDKVKGCLVDEKNPSLIENFDHCPSGTFADPALRQCVGTEYEMDTNCPPGFFYSVESSGCQALDDKGVCPEGYQSLGGRESCIPEDFKALPRCKSIEIRFPVSEVTVKESTRCLKEPGNTSEIVSALKPFDVVEVLGLGESSEELVINNPDYNFPCWAPLDDFYLDQLDLSILPIVHSE